MGIATDLRYAVKLLIRTPAFTLTAAISLALAIAVNTTLFSVVNAVLLRPLGAPGDGEIVRIGRTVRDDGSFRSASYDELTYLREHASSLSIVAGHQLESLVLAGSGESAVVSAEIVTGNYFAALGLPPAVGRGFAPDEDRLSADAAVVVVSDRFWRRRLGADPAILGRMVALNTHRFTIVGVGRPGFAGTFPGVDVDLWVPAAMNDAVLNRGDGRGPMLMLFGRVKPGVTLATARAELQTLARQMLEADPGRGRDRGFAIAPARGAHPALARVATIFLSLLMAVVAAVLLVACANVASLLLARASERRGELAVRLALGASRRRVMRQLLVESGLLALAGGTAGLVLAFWAVRLLNTLDLTGGPIGGPIFLNLQLDTRVLLFSAAITMMTTLVFGLVPAIQATRIGVLAELQDSPALGGRTRSRVRGAIVIAQVALSFVLVAGSVLLFRSLRHTATLDVGFDPGGAVVSSFDLGKLGYERPQIENFYDELLRRARGLPGVERAALADFVPMGSRGTSVALTIPGLASPAGDDHVNVSYNRISGEYFPTIRQPLLRGRDFTPRDVAGAPLVVIVNETMARRFWPHDDALGKVVRLSGETADREIVGIARDAKYASFGGAVDPFVFFPIGQFYGPMLILHVRTRTPPAAALREITRLAQQIDPNAPPYNGQTLKDASSFILLPARIGQAVFGVAGGIALLLAIGGLYGLVCYTLAQRTKEIGIRVALGATRRRVFRLIVGGAVRLTVVGVLIGIVLAAGAMRPFATFLYGLTPTDPLTFSATAALLMLVTLGAGYAASRRGLNVDPMVVLREH